MKKVISFSLILVLIFVAVNKQPINAYNPYKIKGICIRGDDIAKEGVADAIDKISKFGYNTVFLLVKTPEGKVFYKSEFLPVVQDILPSLVEYAHKKSIKVYTYFPIVMDKNFSSQNPTEQMVNSGNTKDPYYVSLISEQYMAYVKNFLMELLKYDIDGVALDYIRFPNGNWDFSGTFLNYAKQNGIDIEKIKSIAYNTFVKPADWKSMFTAYENGDKDVVKWIELRNSVVRNVEFVIKEYVKSIKPDMTVGSFIVARGYRYNKISEVPSITDTFTYQIVNFAQSPDIFKDNIDFLAPMVYLSSLKENSSYATVVTNNIKSSLGEDFPVYIAINPDGISTEETEKEIFNAFKDSDGIVLFRYPLFDMGKLTFDTYPIPQSTANLTFETSKGETLNAQLKIENKNFIPEFKDTVFVSNYFYFLELKLIIGNKTFLKNGENYQMDVAPFIEDSRTFVPARFVSEALNSNVLWDGVKREVTIKGVNTVVLKIGSKSYSINEKNYQMDVAPFIEDSRTFVPARFVSEALNSNVLWDGVKREVTILNLFKLN
jgi:uncharacterized lipoprotein YddW (UPF0748 family)